MFFGTSARKRYIRRARDVLCADLHAARSLGINPPDRDAVILFSGFSHFYIGYNISFGRIQAGDIPPLLNHSALTVRDHAPNHHLGVTYLQETGDAVKRAIERTDADFLKWIPLYHATFADKLTMTEPEFVGSLSADVLSIIQGRF